MDPNLFHIDWERTVEALAVIVVLAFSLERALAPLFESRFFIKRLQGKNIKELMAACLGIAVCWYWDFDVISIVLVAGKTTLFGTIITGAIIAGGSKASVKLFRDILGWKSSALREYESGKKVRPQPGSLVS